ncbi:MULTISPECIES: bifunctional diguanylate cyclase/phosphodiesterase [Cellvibrio]|uniref:Diguanylate cyclase (GGDEF)-like protein n=1 Tax=Cellvibrio fibrivorans TaxID=126350 RepID=A0ABU1V1Q2_9GAMM|nr:EAL domain-containing protein [Cellvibrio fibrivorans]MDR7091380.1 diguanylate cyclase (GGDEF)-like protein [Cellvibrio fibrivorans]
MSEAVPLLFRRPRALALLVLAICLSLSTVVIWQLEQNQRHAKRADVENLAQNHTFLVRDSLDQALTLNYSFAAMVRLGQGSTGRFEDAARELLPYFDSVSHVSLAPGGIITRVYPLEGNEKSVGLNLLEDSFQNKEALRARDTGKLTLAGPVNLVQGGLGAVARLPVFLEDQGGRHFWGFTLVVIRINRLLETANLTQLNDQGMAYQLWRTNPDTGVKDTIAANAPEQLNNPVHKSFAVPNGTWTLSVAPIEGWINGWRLCGEALVALILSLLLAYLARLMVMLQRQHLSLQDAVSEQTRELLVARAHLQATLDAIPDLLFDIDLNGIIHSYHTNQPDLLTVPPTKFLGKSFHLFLPEDACIAVHEALDEALEKGVSSGKCYSIMIPRGPATFELSVSRKADDHSGVPRFLVLSRDITQRKENEARINNLAFFDSLTQLPNRRLLYERLGHAIATSRHQQSLGALLFIDLDDFKTLNDNRGHHIGDLLLIAVAERLKQALRRQDTVARLGGDEFLVVLEGLDQERNSAASQAQQIAEKILASLNNAYQLEGQDYFNSPSIGLCLFGDQDVAIDDLLKQADQAMYHAKAAGRNTLRFFDPEMQAVTAQRFALQNEIREALQQRQFQLYYQPQMNHVGKVVGAEALIRWIHPQRGMIPPLDFIPLAEESGLILALGNWIFATACAQLVEWSKSTVTADIVLSVNVSARQFQHPDFVAQLLLIIHGSGINPHRLKLELTESMLVANQHDIITKMDALKTHGIKFSLDDFGTGYSSLSYLKRLPISELKIDKSFVNDILSDTNGAAIARMIIRLAQSMELTVIAEGVETKAQRDWLESEGCFRYQGYYFGRPVAIENFPLPTE